MTRSKAALLLVDFQNDFLSRAGLVPSAEEVVAVAGRVLGKCREFGVPVVHVHTVTKTDGSDRMPHWKASEVHDCAAESDGASPPAVLQPRVNEPVIEKQFFSGFQNASLAEELRKMEVETLLVAGLYSHGCVRSTVLDAYARGYRVIVIEDAIASPELEHARLSNEWLRDRAARFAPASEMLAELCAEGALGP